MGDREAVQRPAGSVARLQLVGGGGAGLRYLGYQRHDCVHLRVDGCDLPEVRREQLAGGKLLCAD